MSKQAEYTKRYREKHTDKVTAYTKEYRQRPEVKERHRKWMKEWRKNNRAKALEIQRKSWHKNADKYNEYRNKKYKTDPEYRNKKIEAENKYKATGRRKELRVRDAPKLRKKSSEWKRDNKELVKKYVRQYKDNVWIEHERKQRKNLDDKYVIKVVKKSMNYIVKTKDIPKDLIEIQKTKIFIHRKLKTAI